MDNERKTSLPANREVYLASFLFLLVGGATELEKRIGVVGIVIEDRENGVKIVNDILSKYADIIVGRMGIPYRERKIAVISLIVDGTTDEIGAMTGQLGIVPGVNVKSALTKK